MSDQAISLCGPIEYNPKFPPPGAKKGYVARINGRVTGAATFDREFLGSEVLIDQPGLYETQRGLKKGGAEQSYYVILAHGDGLISSLDVGRENAMVIAKRISLGQPIGRVVELTGRPSKRDASRTVYEATIRSAAEAKRAAAAETVGDAADACWAILAQLDEKSRKAVLAEIKRRAMADHG